LFRHFNTDGHYTGVISLAKKSSQDLISAPIQTPALETTQPSIQRVPGLFPGGEGVKRQQRCGVDHPPHLAPMLKKEHSYTFTPPVGLCGLL